MSDPSIQSILRGVSMAALVVVAASATAEEFIWQELAAGSKSAPEAPRPAKQSTAEAMSADPIDWGKPNLPPRKGPKQTIAVGKFDTIGSFTRAYGDWDIGGGVAAMLATALYQSDYFIVTERANLQQVLTEQELKSSGAVRASTGPALGNLTGNNLIVYGAVTEFGAQDDGMSFSLGLTSGLLGSALSHERSSGTVAFDIRVVDSSTGNIVDSFTVKEEINNEGFDVSVTYDQLSMGTNKFANTPLGATTRKAIVRAVEKIALKADGADWSALVVDLDGEDIYINAGRLAGVETGSKFVVERVAKRLIDPASGELLGVRTEKIGLFEVVEVQEKMSIGKYLPLSADAPKAGDLVKTRR